MLKLDQKLNEIESEIKKVSNRYKSFMICTDGYLSNTNIRFVCEKCGKAFIKKWGEYRRKDRDNKRCPFCSKKQNLNKMRRANHSIRYSLDDLKRFTKEISNGKIEVLSKTYNGKNASYDFRCKECEFIFNLTMKTIIRYYKSNKILECSKCKDDEKLFYTDEWIDRHLHSSVTRIENSKGSREAILFKCNKGHTFKMSPSQMFSKRVRKENVGKCPICNKIKSFGEEKLSKIFTGWGINFVREYIVDGGGLSKYRLDFFVPEYSVGIEFDGIYHFDFSLLERIGKLNRSINLKMIDISKKTMERDYKKEILCVQNKISLIRIPFWVELKGREREFIKLLEQIKNKGVLLCLI